MPVRNKIDFIKRTSSSFDGVDMSNIEYYIGHITYAYKHFKGYILEFGKVSLDLIYKVEKEIELS